MAKPPPHKDPALWTAVAVDLLNLKPGDLAKDISKFLQTQPNLQQQLLQLYPDVMARCFAAHEPPLTFSLTRPKPTATSFDLNAFDPHFPMAHPVFRDLLTQVRQQAVERTGQEAVGQQLEAHIRESFGRQFRVAVADLATYDQAHAYINLVDNGFDTSEGQIIVHTNAILHALAHEPLPIDPDLTLAQVYITPRARYWDDLTPDKGQDGTVQEVPDLMTTLLKTLGNAKTPVVLHGQPGHGKSSTVRMLTHAIARTQPRDPAHPRTQVLLYEFKDLGGLNRNEIQILAERTPFVSRAEFFHGQRTVLIVDGMDERQITDGSDTPLKDFIRHLFTLADGVNRRSDSRLNLVLTGRTQFVRQIQNAFSGPYHLFEIQDFTADQVATWLETYCRLKQAPQPLTIEDFKSRHLNELITQPILLTITAMMLIDPEGQRLMGDIPPGEVSRGAIYRTIIAWTYWKKWQHHPSRTALPDEAVYTRFLRMIAFIMFREGQESIPTHRLIEALKDKSELYDLESLRHKDMADIEDLCRHVAVSFFFRGLENNVFSFIHKSIKDYLTVEAWLDLLGRATDGFRPTEPGRSCDRMAEDLYFLFGGQAVSHEDHAALLRDVLRLRQDEAEPLFEPLSHFFKAAQSHRYLHECTIKGSDPVGVEANLLASLFRLLTEIFHLRAEVAPDGESSREGLKLFEEHDGFYKFISLLQATGHIRFFNEHFDLRRHYLEGALLEATDLARADLQGADLQRADLQGADLQRANLKRANLQRAELKGANLQEANLQRANLQRARNLTSEQIASANIDEHTQLPEGLARPEAES